MAWYWIVLIVIGYMLMWILTSVITYKHIEGTCDIEIVPSVVTGMLWPIVIPLALIGAIVKLIVEK